MLFATALTAGIASQAMAAQPPSLGVPAHDDETLPALAEQWIELTALAQATGQMLHLLKQMRVEQQQQAPS